MLPKLVFKLCPRHTRILSRAVQNKYAGCCFLKKWFSQKGQKSEKMDISDFPPENIRNFSIIAHVDHGKSTLADRLLELTGVIPKTADNKQVLDRLQVERERGITVKAQTASLIYEYKGSTYLLNLIDTPGHVDFNYEVARSLAACQGVILLVDANQGVQAQTVANFYLAFASNLTIVPALNKIDLKVAQPDVVMQQLQNLFEINPEEVFKISAKLGTGVEDVLQAVIDRIPPPSGVRDQPLKMMLFDSYFDPFRGVVPHFAVINGKVKKGDKIKSCHSKNVYEVQEVGIMHPFEVPVTALHAGQVGYITCGIKKTKEALLGDTFHHVDAEVEPLPGFKPAKAMVFSGVFPNDQSEYPALRTAIDKLTLNDSSVDVHPDSSPVLGQGWRLGFLGLLHMDVFQQRLEQEYQTTVVVTSPNVPYKVKIMGSKNIKKNHGESDMVILNPCLLPDRSITEEMQEPMVVGTILTPDDYIADITSLCMDRRGHMLDQTYIDTKRVMLKVSFPLNEILVDFFDRLKSVSSGFASFDYEDAGYQISDLVKLDFLLNGQIMDEMTMIVHASKARETCKRIVARLKEDIPRQNFLIVVQGAVGAKILARENIKAYRKDVTAKLYGGDITRSMKLLKQQAKGKKRMRMIGKVEVPRQAFINAMKR